MWKEFISEQVSLSHTKKLNKDIKRYSEQKCLTHGITVEKKDAKGISILLYANIERVDTVQVCFLLQTREKNIH